MGNSPRLLLIILKTRDILFLNFLVSYGCSYVAKVSFLFIFIYLYSYSSIYIHIHLFIFISIYLYSYSSICIHIHVIFFTFRYLFSHSCCIFILMVMHGSVHSYAWFIFTARENVNVSLKRFTFIVYAGPYVAKLMLNNICLKSITFYSKEIYSFDLRWISSFIVLTFYSIHIYLFNTSNFVQYK